MTEPKFTPGEWIAGKNPNMTTYLDGHEGKAIYLKNGSFHIAWANAENEDGELDMQTALANAALIAAAPEMYAALESACTVMSIGYVCTKMCQGCPLGKALRKARGEESEASE